jgi:hypothetical protein
LAGIHHPGGCPPMASSRLLPGGITIAVIETTWARSSRAAAISVTGKPL